MDHHSETERRRTEFMHLIGTALSNWQGVEAEAYHIYSAMMRGADKKLISVSWHHIQSFNAKIELLKHCGHFALAGVAAPTWEPLLKRLRVASNARNAIVHGSFGIRFSGGNNAPGEPTLHVSYFDATAISKGWVVRNELKPERRIKTDKLVSYCDEFAHLSAALQAFRKSHLAHG